MNDLKPFFNDCLGQRWDTAVTASTIRRVQSETQTNLLGLVDAKTGLLQKCYDDPVALFSILCAVVRPQIVALGLTDDEFGDRLDTESLCEASVDAMLDGVVGFFPPERRAILARALGKLRAARTAARAKAVRVATERLESPELDKLIAEALQTALGD